MRSYSENRKTARSAGIMERAVLLLVATAFTGFMLLNVYAGLCSAARAVADLF